MLSQSIVGVLAGASGEAAAELLSPVHPPPLARWGAGMLRQREMQLSAFLVGSCRPVGLCKGKLAQDPSTAEDGVWVQPAPAPALAFLFSC